MGTSPPLTKRDIEQGRLRSYKITIRQTGWGDLITVDIAGVSAARALRVLADRLDDPSWIGPDWTMPHE